MPTDMSGIEYEEIDETVLDHDSERVVYVPSVDERRILFEHSDGTESVTTISDMDYSCPMCSAEQPPLRWEVPSASLCCGRCGFMSLGTRMLDV